MQPSALCASVPVALLSSFVLAALYVGCLYVWAGHHTNGRRAPDRDDPRVVKERFIRVGLVSLLAPCVTLAAAALPGGRTPCTPEVPLLRWFGLAPPSALSMLLATLLPLLLTMVLFIGPLFTAWIDRDEHSPLATQLRQRVQAADARTLRNLVVGPVSEEWVFRACMCPLLRGAGLSDSACVFTSGAVFGLAHVHHVFDANAPWIAVAVQFTYTSLFGTYSSYLFLRSGMLYGAVLAHAFCNLMGLPDFGRAIDEKRTTGVAFVVGLGSFIVLVTLDAIYRLPLFHSALWAEAAM